MSEPRFTKLDNGQSRAVIKTDEELAAEAPVPAPSAPAAAEDEEESTEA